jgi:predicted DNA-binding protein
MGARGPLPWLSPEEKKSRILHVRVSPELEARLLAESGRRRRGFSEIIRELLDRHLPVEEPVR